MCVNHTGEAVAQCVAHLALVQFEVCTTPFAFSLIVFATLNK